MSYLTEDSLAIILICSNLGINYKSNDSVKPYNLKQWNDLADRLKQSSLKKPEAFFNTKEEVLKKELFLKEEEIFQLKKLLERSGQIGIEIENLRSQGIFITTRAEKNYPQRLKNILKKNCPPVIYYCGDIGILDSNSVAIVGSRNVDEKGLKFTKNLARRCVDSGLTVVSGGARGVDKQAEDITLQAGGKVVSVLSDGLSKKIMQREVRESIINGNLLLLSAVNPKSRFTVYNAMNRNKYIYVLSDYAVVISSKINKGGTWAGATENLKNGWAPLFVRKDDEIPKGNLELLSMGGIPLFKEVLDNTTINMFDWFTKNKGTKKFTQMSIDDILDRDEKYEKNTKDKDLAIRNRVDLFKVVWPYIEKELNEPKSKYELSSIFDLNQSQINIWINRAVNENKVTKLVDCDKYVLANK